MLVPFLRFDEGFVGKLYGVTHAAEVPYIFGDLFHDDFVDPFREAQVLQVQRNLTHVFQHYWFEYAR